MFKVIIITLVIGALAIVFSIFFSEFMFKILFGAKILKYTYLT